MIAETPLPSASAGVDSSRCAVHHEKTMMPRVPMYMIFLDLAFAAAFSVIGDWLDFKWSHQDNGWDAMLVVVRFFLVFLCVSWIWDQANRVFNRFDQEDLVTELVVIVLMMGVMCMALNVRGCFFPSLLGVPESPTDSCMYFIAGFAGCRAVLTGVAAYVAIYVRPARPTWWREVGLWLLLVPILIFADSDGCVVGSAPPWPPAPPATGSHQPSSPPSPASSTTTCLHVPLCMLAATVVDAIVSLADQLPRCALTARLVDAAIPLEPAYTKMRYERMLIIVIGFICVYTTHEAYSSLETFDGRAVAMCLTTPWSAFLIKLWYFGGQSLQIGEACGQHASEVSPSRAIFWSLLHLPLYGSIVWWAIAQTKLLGTAAMHAHRETWANGRWQLCAAFTLFMLVLTLQQVLHRGSGRGKRRCGKHRRVYLRAGGVALLCAAQPGIAALTGYGGLSGNVLSVLLMTIWITLLAIVEHAAREEKWTPHVRRGDSDGTRRGVFA